MTEFSHLTLSGIAHRCNKENSLYFKGEASDPRYCYELFHRALRENDQQAWDAVIRLFTPLVLSWIHKHELFTACGAEVEVLINGSFTKMWSALSGTKFDEQGSLAGVLSYLKTCVNSEIMDAMRVVKRDQYITSIDVMPNPLLNSEHPGNVPFHEFDKTKLWTWVDTKLNGEKEKIVVYASFFLAYKPKEILSEYRNVFSDVNEIYRLKENIIARLKRAEELELLI